MRSARTIALFTLTLQFAFAQDGQFSQYFASSAVLNPALIGTVPTLSFNSNYKRSGGSDQEAFFELWQATVSMPFEKRQTQDYQVGAAGITFLSERRGFRGIYQAQRLMFTGAYVLRLSRLSNQQLVFGLQAGITENRINDNNLQWGSQYNRYIGFDDTLPDEFVSVDPLYYPSVNFGIIYSLFDNQDTYIRDRSLRIGLAVDHLNEPEITNKGFNPARKPFLIKTFGSGKFNLNPRVDLFPSVYALYSQGSIQINSGLYLSTFVSGVATKAAMLLQAGAWYRLNDAVIILAGLKVEEIEVGVSFDLNTSDFDINEALGNQRPAYEVSLRYNLNLTPNYLRGVSNPIF